LHTNDKLHEHTYDATHAHCTNKLLEGDLTYAMLIKMYTNQCFHKYPHFQLSELNENKKYSNNSNRFRSSSPGKGKQTKGKGNNRNHKWRDGKGKRGNQIKKAISPATKDKGTLKIQLKQKEKELKRVPKGKERTKANHDTATERVIGKRTKINKTRKQNQ
jgi:hypothetical protein